MKSAFIATILLGVFLPHDAIARIGDRAVARAKAYETQHERRRRLSSLAPSSMIITEIMYDPTACSDSSGEWVELFNNGSTDVDLAGWSISDPSKTTIFTSGVVTPGSYFIVGRTTGGCDGALNADATTTIALNQGGDTVTLKDNHGSIIDVHTYASGAASAGFSIQRQADASSGNPTDTWEQGVEGGSPRAGYSAVGGGSSSSTDPPSSSPSTTTRTYEAFELELECGESAGYATRFTYELVGPDNADYARSSSFYMDENLPTNCQQTSLGTYQHSDCGSTGRNTNPYCFDRGHLVMANHLDNSAQHILESNYMTNVLPQATGFNRAGGAWIYTEYLIECSRDVSTVQKQVIFGGAIFNDPTNDYFLQSHGIPTPDIFWKVVVRYETDGTQKVMSWLLPNHYSTIDDNMAQYISTVSEIQSLTGDSMPELPDSYTEETDPSAWDSVLTGCDKSR